MTTDIYDFKGRVEYADFCEAAQSMILAASQAAGIRFANRNHVHIDAKGGNTASIRAEHHVGAKGKAETFYVSLPSLLPDTLISGQAARGLLAFILHETGHLVCTDMHTMADPNRYQQTIINALQAKGHASAGPQDCGAVHGLMNALEDFFIEFSMCNPDKPIVGNMPKLIGMLNEAISAEPYEKGRGFPADPLSRVSNYILTQFNRHGRMIAPRLDAIQPNIVAILDPAWRGHIDAFLVRLEAMENDKGAIKAHRSTFPVRLEMALDLYLWARAQNAQSGFNPGHHPDPNAAGTGGSLKTGQGRPGPGQGGGSGSGGASAKTSDQQRADALAGFMPNTPDRDKNLAASLPVGLPHVDEIDRKKHYMARADLLAIAGKFDARKLADAARRALKSPENITLARRLSTGRLDRRALARIQLGALDTMTRRTAAPGVTTAVHVLIDGSSSMQAGIDFEGEKVSRFAASLGAAIALLPAIARAGGKVALSQFQNDQVVKICTYSDKVRSGNFVELCRSAFSEGGTPMVRQARWANKYVLTQKATRHVVLWIMDGQPDDPVHKEIARLRRKTGVEHVAIGIGCDVQEAAGGKEYARTVDNAADLPKAFLELLIPKQVAG